MPSSLPVAFIQHAMQQDRETNLSTSLCQIEAAARQGAKLIVLPELHCSRYFCQTQDQTNFALAEPIPGETTDRIAQLALDCRVVIVASIFEHRAPGLYHNTAVVIDSDGSIAGTYRKMHIPDDPGYNEKYYFTPGDQGFNPINTTIGRLGVLVCWDQWFPEAARIMALKGAEILIYPTAIGWDPNECEQVNKRQLENWMIAQRAHAIANGIPVIACNRIGHEKASSSHEQIFWGNSFICDATGSLLNHATQQDTCIGMAQLSLNSTEQQRQTWPFLRDRRIDAYSDILVRYFDKS